MSRDRWGEKFNSPGAKLNYKEVGRISIDGKTVVTYSLFASGLPKDGHYVLWSLNVGSDPRALADAYLNESGKVVNVLADPQRHIPEDPINVKAFGGKGEPIQFALISDNQDLRAFVQIVPFPLEETSGTCHLSAVETAPYYSYVFLTVTGLQPNEELMIDQQSGSEAGHTPAKADDQGAYRALVSPLIKGKRSGNARIYFTAKSCKIGVQFPWGEGSYRYQ